MTHTDRMDESDQDFFSNQWLPHFNKTFQTNADRLNVADVGDLMLSFTQKLEEADEKKTRSQSHCAVF